MLVRRPPSVFTVVTGSSILLLATILLASCGSDPAPAETVCGGVERDGECYQLCEDDKCIENNVCVFLEDRPEGYCTLACENNDACPWGYACYSNVPGSSGEAGTYCLNLGLPEQGKSGVACSSESECDTGHGVHCFEGFCSFPCSSILSTCPEGLMCKGAPNALPGTPGGFCVTATADLGVPGRYGADCPFGDSQCDAGAGFICIGGEGSAHAHCSKPDGCTTDQDCPSGYWCGAIRTIEGNDIDFTKQPRTCLQRGFCDPCDTDMDCSHTTNAICVPGIDGENFCSSPCEVGTDSCIIGARCEDVGEGRAACRPNVGYCYSKDPKGCDPCRIDPDCGPNGVCASGKWGYKPAMNWCSTPCGPVDEHGKNPCPLAPNGLEMLCMDEHMYALGGPFSSSDPSYLYKHCYAPLTIDNSELYPGSPPAVGVCGNGKVEPGEECDDGNTDPKDGCADCKVTPECSFTISEPNGDGNPAVAPVPNHIKMSGDDMEPAVPFVISTGVCKTFKVEGAIETPGDVDVIAIMLPGGGELWVDTYTSSVGSCTADLVTEARAWKNGLKESDENLLDLSVPCEKLSDSPQNYVNSGQACPESPTHLGCGTCDGPGVCGVCDDDSGIGNCTRMLVNTRMKLGPYPIYFDGAYKVLRVYARDPGTTVGNFILIGSRFTSQAFIGPSTPVVLSCY